MAYQEDRRIGDVVVFTKKLPPVPALKLFARLGKIAIPIAKALQPGILERIKAGDVSMALPLAMAVFTELSDTQAEELALATLQGTSVQISSGDRPRILHLTRTSDINVAFEDNLKGLLSAMLFALEVNFKDFFDVPAQSGNPTPTPSL